MYKKVLLGAAMLSLTFVCAAVASDSTTIQKTTPKSATTQRTPTASPKSWLGCRACHAAPTWRPLPESHASLTEGPAQCLSCHSRSGNVYSPGPPYIPHVLGEVGGS